MTPAETIAPGQVVAGRFQLTSPLGRGAMGSVWLARHLTLDVDVAVKFIDAEHATTPGAASRFEREARAAAQIKSAHVVAVLDYGVEAGRPYLAMEYLQGETLEQRLLRQGRLSPPHVGALVAQLARGLSAAHALGIIHRDLKPDNLFLCRGPEAPEGALLKIVDFGVAKTPLVGGDVNGTVAGQLVGSPKYMSPEQARGETTIDFRSDLFSLGVVAYRCLTGTLPFRGTLLPELLLQIVNGEPARASSLVPTLPPGVDAFFARALHKVPAQRFSSAAELAAALSEALGHAPRVELPRGPLDEMQATTLTRTRLDGSSSSGTSGVVSRRSGDSVGSLRSALEQIGRVPGVLGIALVDEERASVIARRGSVVLSDELVRGLLARVHAALDAVDGYAGEQMPEQMVLAFERATVTVTWVGLASVVLLTSKEAQPSVVAMSLKAVLKRLTPIAGDTLDTDGLARDLGSESGTDQISVPLSPIPLDAAARRTRRFRGREIDVGGAAPAAPASPQSRSSRSASRPGEKETDKSDPARRRVKRFRGRIIEE